MVPKCFRNLLFFLAGVILFSGVSCQTAKAADAQDVSFNVSVITYHHFVPGRHQKTYNGSILDPQVFEKHLQYLAANNYTVITLKDLYFGLQGEKSLPAKGVVITMDDGYESVYHYAYPLLKKYHMPATVFLIAGKIMEDTSAHLDSRYQSYLTAAQIKEMKESGLFDFQSHTYDLHRFEFLDSSNYSHRPALSNKIYLPSRNRRENQDDYNARVLNDLKLAKETIEDITGEEVFALSYPYGHYNNDVQQLALSAGYSMMLTTMPGFVVPGDSPLEIKRMMIVPKDSLFAFRKKLFPYVPPPQVEPQPQIEPAAQNLNTAKEQTGSTPSTQ